MPLLPPLALFAPERPWQANSLGKSLLRGTQLWPAAERPQHGMAGFGILGGRGYCSTGEPGVRPKPLLLSRRASRPHPPRPPKSLSCHPAHHGVPPESPQPRAKVAPGLDVELCLSSLAVPLAPTPSLHCTPPLRGFLGAPPGTALCCWYLQHGSGSGSCSHSSSVG